MSDNDKLNVLRHGSRMLHVVGSKFSSIHAQTARGTVARNDTEVAAVAGIVPFQESSQLKLLIRNAVLLLTN